MSNTAGGVPVSAEERLNRAWKELIATAMRRNVVVAVGDHRAAVEDAARAAGVSVPTEPGAPDRGFAADRPTGPRTAKGHALATRLRARDPEVDWDAWIRDIEAEAVSR